MKVDKEGISTFIVSLRFFENIKYLFFNKGAMMSVKR